VAAGCELRAKGFSLQSVNLKAFARFSSHDDNPTFLTTSWPIMSECATRRLLEDLTVGQALATKMPITSTLLSTALASGAH
jgi:hypothetical protein